MLGRLRARGEGDGRGWDGWMASLTQWTCIWANSGKEWRTGNSGVLQPMGSQRVVYDLLRDWKATTTTTGFSPETTVKKWNTVVFFINVWMSISQIIFQNNIVFKELYLIIIDFLLDWVLIIFLNCLLIKYILIFSIAEIIS